MRSTPLFSILCLGLIAAFAAVWLDQPAPLPPLAFAHKATPPSTTILPPPAPAVADRTSIFPSQQDFLQAIEGLRLDAKRAGVDPVVRLLAEQDAATVESILRKVSDREMCGYLLNRVVIQWAAQNPAATAAWLLHLPTQVEHTQALISAGRVWAQSDPRGAADYAASFPAGPLRQQVLTAAVSEWISRDLPEAAAWINQFPPGPDFDAIVAQIARDPALIDADSAAALTWAESISNDAARFQSVSLILAPWAERDPAAVIQYTKTTPVLTDDQRVAILEHFHLGH